MTVRLRVLLGLCLFLGAGAFIGFSLFSGGSDVELRAHDEKLVEQGAALYLVHCATCHGVELKGQAGWRQRGEDDMMLAPPHNASGHTWHHADELLFEITKYGSEAVVGDGYRSNMRGFDDVLDDQDIIAVLSYIKSTWPEEIKRHHDTINERAKRR